MNTQKCADLLTKTIEVELFVEFGTGRRIIHVNKDDLC